MGLGPSLYFRRDCFSRLIYPAISSSNTRSHHTLSRLRAGSASVRTCIADWRHQELRYTTSTSPRSIWFYSHTDFVNTIAPASCWTVVGPKHESHIAARLIRVCYSQRRACCKHWQRHSGLGCSRPRRYKENCRLSGFEDCRNQTVARRG